MAMEGAQESLCRVRSGSYAAKHVPTQKHLLSRLPVALMAAMVLLSGCRRPAAESNGALPENVPAPANAGSASAVKTETVSDKLPLPVAVAQILNAAQRSGSVIERCQCGAGSRLVEAHIVSGDAAQKPIEEAFKSITERYPEMHWQEYGDGRVRVADKQSRAGLLKVRVRQFLVIEDRPPQASLPALLQTAEVQAYMRKHHMRVARPSHAAGKVIKTSPMVIQTKNATVEQILDRMVDGYHSSGGRPLYRAWGYRECQRKGGTLVEIGIY
jgi:hypothetical protein